MHPSSLHILFQCNFACGMKVTKTSCGIRNFGHRIWVYSLKLVVECFIASYCLWHVWLVLTIFWIVIGHVKGVASSTQQG